MARTPPRPVLDLVGWGWIVAGAVTFAWLAIEALVSIAQWGG